MAAMVLSMRSVHVQVLYFILILHCFIPILNHSKTSGFSFWGLFAIFFPAATGIMAGVNMSGNLKNPTRSIPLGTLGAIVVATIVYGAQIIICGGAIPREVLINKPYHSLLQIAPFHTGFLVTIGVFSATLSSAIGSLLGRPRVLQSLGEDRILKPINFFSGLSKSGEPHRALIFTFIVGLLVVYFVGNGSEGGALNMVASIVTMLFLWTYGITNLAAFVESFSRNPSFRPRFKFFHWFPALAGACACFAVSFLVDAVAATFAVVFVGGLSLYVRKYILTASFGDAQRGFFLHQKPGTTCSLFLNCQCILKTHALQIVVLLRKPTASTYSCKIC